LKNIFHKERKEKSISQGQGAGNESDGACSFLCIRQTGGDLYKKTLGMDDAEEGRNFPIPLT